MGPLEKRALGEAERLEWLRLIRSENVGPVTFYRLLEFCGSAGEALARLPDLARKGGRKRALKIAGMAEVEAEYEKLTKLGGWCLALVEPHYPRLLAQTDGAPPVICGRGHPHLLERAKVVAIVGARNASAAGRGFAARMARELGDAGYLVVSGMARGIDTAAHDGALKSGTLAVLGGGVDVVYPRENEALYGRLCESGAILAEAPLGTEPQARHFPRRNRIISGLSLGVIVVEAAIRSGSLITARLAAEQGREVFAVPGSPLDPRARGCNRLIRDGAALIENAADVLAALEQGIRPLTAEPEQRSFAGFDGPAAPEDLLDRQRPKLEELLGPVPVSVDEILRQCEIAPAVLQVLLLELELAGRLTRHAGHRVSLQPPDQL